MKLLILPNSIESLSDPSMSFPLQLDSKRIGDERRGNKRVPKRRREKKKLLQSAAIWVCVLRVGAAVAGDKRTP
jgi:hypothetical protein